MRTVIAACVAIGAVTVIATLVIGHKTPTAATPEYGKRLLTRCATCHIDAGAEPGELTLIHAISRKDLTDRINECIDAVCDRCLRLRPQRPTHLNCRLDWRHDPSGV